VVTSFTQGAIEQMRDQVFFEGPERNRQLSRYWLLLLLSAVIATAGGGERLRRRGDRGHDHRPADDSDPGSRAGCGADGPGQPGPVPAAAGRGCGRRGRGELAAGPSGPLPGNSRDEQPGIRPVTPRLVDLVAALATGAVGSVALTRPDISDTLPGVAIAISLVPPLAVADLTLQSGSPSQCLGALLPFATNVVAILASGIVVMALYRVGRVPGQAAAPAFRRPAGFVIIVLLLGAVLVPLWINSDRVDKTTIRQVTCRRWPTTWPTTRAGQ